MTEKHSMRTRYRRRFFATACLVSLSVLAITASARQSESGVTVASTLVRIYPDLNRTPLATLSPGTSVQIVERKGDWLRISFVDRTYGDRTGYVRAEDVKAGGLNQPPAPRAPDAQTQPTMSTAPPATGTATSATPESARMPSTVTARQPRLFPDAKLTVPEGEKTKQVDVTVSYTVDTFQLLDKNTRQLTKEFPYKSFVGGEYWYSKSPRWKSGLFISPFLFLSSGKKHWLLVKTADDYVMLRLDKNNYKLIIAEWETKTGHKVEAQGDNK